MTAQRLRTQSVSFFDVKNSLFFSRVYSEFSPSSVPPALRLPVSLFLFLTLISVVAVWVEPSDRLQHLHHLWGEDEKKPAGEGGVPYKVLGITAGGTSQTLNP